MVQNHIGSIPWTQYLGSIPQTKYHGPLPKYHGPNTMDQIPWTKYHGPKLSFQTCTRLSFYESVCVRYMCLLVSEPACTRGLVYNEPAHNLLSSFLLITYCTMIFHMRELPSRTTLVSYLYHNANNCTFSNCEAITYSKRIRRKERKIVTTL